MAQLQIMGTAEVARLLRVAKARVWRMTRDGILPAPDARLDCGPIWAEATIADFLASWSRQNGRASEFYGRRAQ